MKKTADVVALIIHEEGRILVEKRKQNRKIDPSKVAIPGGHVKEGESFEDACKRELKEELDLDCDSFRSITTLCHDSDLEKQMVHYYSCENWRGIPKSREAEKVFWIDVKSLDVLDFKIDRNVAKDFFRPTM